MSAILNFDDGYLRPQSLVLYSSGAIKKVDDSFKSTSSIFLPMSRSNESIVSV
jgi:hypothetical protein